MNTPHTVQAADHIHAEPTPLTSLHADPGQPPVRDMAPLPPPNAFYALLDLIYTDPFSAWFFGVVCGIGVCILAMEVGISLTYRLFLYH